MVPVVFACCRCTLRRFERTASDQSFEDSGGEPVVVTNQIKAEALHNRIVYAASTSAFTVFAHTCIQVCVKYERAHLHAFCFLYVLILSIVTNLSIN